MRVLGQGVLLTGVSGVGKSELALELLSRGHQLIADDATEFHLRAGAIHGRCPPLLHGYLEARSLGILNVRKLYGPRSVGLRARLEMIIRLDAPDNLPADGYERIRGHRSLCRLGGVDVPEISIPIRLGHNLAVLVEAACRELRLRKAGYHADEDFTARQLEVIRSTRP
jgi:serine kinase of HPr protein (carbohydrate metabolism regulator)